MTGFGYNINGFGIVVAVGDVAQSFPSGNSIGWFEGTGLPGYAYQLDFDTHPTDSTKAVAVSRLNTSGEATIITRDGITLSSGAGVEFDDEQAYYLNVVCGKVSGQFLVYFKPATWDAAASQWVFGYPTARVGTIDGNTCTFGTAAVAESSSRFYLFAAADPNTDNKYIVGYKNASDYLECRVATVDGTDVSFGSAVSFTDTSGPEHTDCFFDPSTAGKFAIVSLNSTGDKPTVTQCTYSGTTISTTATYSNFATADAGKDARGAYDASNGNIVVACRAKSAPYYPFVKPVTSDGTLGTKVVVVSESLAAAGNRTIDIDGDPDNTTRFVIQYNINASPDSSYARSILTSGTGASSTCTVDTAVELSSDGSAYHDASVCYWHGQAGKCLVSYYDADEDSERRVVVGQGATPPP